MLHGSGNRSKRAGDLIPVASADYGAVPALQSSAWWLKLMPRFASEVGHHFSRVWYAKLAAALRHLATASSCSLFICKTEDLIVR
jgi:hypothetical protein